jgi:dTMP kinase
VRAGDNGVRGFARRARGSLRLSACAPAGAVPPPRRMSRPTAGRGRFVTLEGIDGAGKSTHQRAIVEHLEAAGCVVVATREPGGTPLGEKLREIVLADPMEAETEALVMFAARREHLARVILPALERGDWVVSDRFTDATYAYQCGGRGVPESRLRVLEDWVQAGLVPDLTLLFDVATDEARRRVERGTPQPDRFEREASPFFVAVRRYYLDLAAREPGRIKLVDTGRPVAEVRAAVIAALDGLLAKGTGARP